jgi:acetyl esterase
MTGGGVHRRIGALTTKGEFNMPVHPESQMILDAIASMGMPPLEDMNPEQLREALGGFAMMMGEGDEVAATTERTIPGPGGDIPVIVYTPAGNGPFPVIIYYHGGGFVGGSAALCDPVCRTLAKKAAAVVVNVEYRLAPEHTFPAAAEDAYAVLEWVGKNAGEIDGDPSRIAVAGDSAGGNLSAVVAQMTRDQGGPALALQALIYPAVDGQSADYPSRKENADGYLLTQASMDMFYGHYIPAGTNPDDPRAYPIRAASLEGLAPAFVATCEFDPLRDEGEAYAERLSQANVPTQVKRYDGHIHGIFWLPGVVEAGRNLMDDVAGAMRQAFSS